MPRGAEYDDGIPHSDNAIEPGHDIIHGGDGKSTSESGVPRANKTADMPEGLQESHDGVHSGGGSVGIGSHTGSGKGGHEPKSIGQHKEVPRT